MDTNDSAHSSEKKGYGFWATIGLTVALLLVMGVAEFATARFLVEISFFQTRLGISPDDIDWIESVEGIMRDGLFFSIAKITSTVAVLLLLFAFVRHRAKNKTAEYLALKPASKKTIAAWTIIFIAYLVASDIVRHFLGRDIVPQFQKDIYSNAGWLPLLFFVVILVAPLMEELLFRGFMFRGVQTSRLGPSGAVVITAFVFTILHGGQYHAFNLATIFVGGLLLGGARMQTGSLAPCVVMHVTQNLISTIQTAVTVS